MRIIILGGGQVGGTLAEHLAGEENDITIVDTSSSRLRELQDRLDVRTLEQRTRICWLQLPIATRST